MKDFRGKVAVITGGVSGIGRALAERCMAEGVAGLVIGDLNPEDLATAAAELDALGPGTVLPIAMDAGKLEDVQRLLDETLSAFGGVHLACFNAGVGGGEGSNTVLDADVSSWQWVEAVNKWGVLYGCKLFGRYMADAALADGTESHIVNTASMAGLVSGGLGAYSTSKHSVVAITEKLAMELQANGAFPAMGTSVLCPGFVDTNIFDAGRYRKAEEAGKAPTIDEDASGMALRMLNKGGAEILSAEEVSDIVFASMASQDLYILPHMQMAEFAVRARSEAILNKAMLPAGPQMGRAAAQQQQKAEAKARL
jgi:NAD(P)-dependent dehydrogenase (short-subunit alcohol dehydrogenase family)